MKENWYKLYRKVENGRVYVGTYKTYKELSKATNISNITIGHMINGIYSIYQDKWDIETFVRRDLDIYRDI